MVIEKQGLPNEFTQGEVGDIYIDTYTGFKFECTSKISIKAGKDTDVKYIWMPVHENYKKMVDDACEVLSDKLMEDVSKDGLVSAIEGINAGAIACGVIKKNGFKLAVTNTDTNIIDYKYANSLVTSLIFVNATSIGNGATQNCISLTNLDMPTVTSIGNNAMSNCISLTNLDMPTVTSISNYAMLNCISLTNLDMSTVTSISSYAMVNCISLKTLKLGANQVATLANTNVFQNTPIAKGRGYIYVPDNLVGSYKTATNWSVYADQIRPMSEYVEEVNE